MTKREILDERRWGSPKSLLYSEYNWFCRMLWLSLFRRCFCGQQRRPSLYWLLARDVRCSGSTVGF